MSLESLEHNLRQNVLIDYEYELCAVELQTYVRPESFTCIQSQVRQPSFRSVSLMRIIWTNVFNGAENIYSFSDFVQT
jgi:hypothetical protein